MSWFPRLGIISTAPLFPLLLCYTFSCSSGLFLNLLDVSLHNKNTLQRSSPFSGFELRCRVHFKYIVLFYVLLFLAKSIPPRRTTIHPAKRIALDEVNGVAVVPSGICGRLLTAGILSIPTGGMNWPLPGNPAAPSGGVMFTPPFGGTVVGDCSVGCSASLPSFVSVLLFSGPGNRLPRARSNPIELDPMLAISMPDASTNPALLVSV